MTSAVGSTCARAAVLRSAAAPCATGGGRAPPTAAATGTPRRPLHEESRKGQGEGREGVWCGELVLGPAAQEDQPAVCWRGSGRAGAAAATRPQQCHEAADENDDAPLPPNTRPASAVAAAMPPSTSAMRTNTSPHAEEGAVATSATAPWRCTCSRTSSSTSCSQPCAWVVEWVEGQMARTSVSLVEEGSRQGATP